MKYLGIKLDLSRDALFSEEGMALMSHYYQKDGKEGVQKALARAANCFSFGDKQLAQEIYDDCSLHNFFFSSPILSNAIEGTWTEDYWKVLQGLKAEGCTPNEARQKAITSCWEGPTPKAMPIACFLTYVGDSIAEQVETASELAFLSVNGGGTAVHTNIRAVSDKAPGPIPYFKTIDATMGYYKQGKTRKGATALYLDVGHPDIVEFLNMRKASGGDPARKIDNRTAVHNGVNITEEFLHAVEHDLTWQLICPHMKEVREVVEARYLWGLILEARELTGEPYLYFIDVANQALPKYQQLLGLINNGSNLCTEITLATSKDRTAVCCLSSVNLENSDNWLSKGKLVPNLVRFLDNVIEWFLIFGNETLVRAKRSAEAERALGIGAMGWANFLMKNNIPFESGGFNSATQHNYRIFSEMFRQGEEASKLLAAERGEPSDCEGSGRRNSHLFAIAPNANSSVLCHTSPSIEPLMSNAYTQKSRAGVHLVKNRYLEQWLEKTVNDVRVYPSFWKDIIDHNGSVQHLTYMDDHTKKVFKTAWEIDQHWVIEHASVRQPFICQAQSLNVFFLPGTERSYINSVHWKAAKERRIKSLYYFRTGSEGVTDNVKAVQRVALKDTVDAGSDCLACEG